jgi:hypothetical protein
MRINLGLTLASLTLVIGCGPDLSHLPKTVPATGVVTLDGKTVSETNVVFISETTNFSHYRFPRAIRIERL